MSTQGGEGAAVTGHDEEGGPARPEKPERPAGAGRRAGVTRGRRSRRPIRTDLGLVGRQVQAEQRAFWRNPMSAGFTFVFPLMFLVIFSSLNSGGKLPDYGNIRYTEYYVPGILAFAIISACFTNLALTLTNRREMGILKRARGTPLPSWALLAGLLGSEALVSLVLAALTVGLGMIAYHNQAPHHVAWALLVLVLGAVTFCALGVAVTSVIPNADSAPAIVNLLVFPLVFLSGTFFPVDNTMLQRISDVFPVRPFQTGFLQSFDPSPLHAGGPALRNLLTLAAWAAAGTVVAATTFRWDKRKQ